MFVLDQLKGGVLKLIGEPLMGKYINLTMILNGKKQSYFELKVFGKGL